MKSILLLTAFFVIGIYLAYAHDHHDDHDKTKPRQENDRTNVAADQINLDWSTNASQLSGGWGSDNSKAISFGKKIDGILWTGMFSKDSKSDDYLGGSFTLRFK